MSNPQPQEELPRTTLEDRLQTAVHASQCVKWLQSQGFEVLGVQKGPRNPRVTIRTSLLCEQLEGAVRRFERSPQGEKRYWVAIRFGCEVRWTEACPDQRCSGRAQ
ncbi:MAG: hypothetical protein A2Y38_12295 [Spirochaetes bacterium GWB1_59_5]|nr:MAG: hypothetical protein A2Y38_12295 [Spirochaetes bacterium GWB1_59_5]